MQDHVTLLLFGRCKKFATAESNRSREAAEK
jgi:hypothetical protein